MDLSSKESIGAILAQSFSQHQKEASQKKYQEAQNRLLKKCLLRLAPFFGCTQQEIYSAWDNTLDDPGAGFRITYPNIPVLSFLDVQTDRLQLSDLFAPRFLKSDIVKDLLKRLHACTYSVTAIQIKGHGVWYFTALPPKGAVCGMPYIYLPIRESERNIQSQYFAYPEMAFLRMFKTEDIDVRTLKEMENDE